MNLLIISGRLGQNAEVKATATGKTVASFSVAVDSGYGDNKRTDWFRCNLWGKRAEGGLVQYLTKGTQVNVTGEVSARAYIHGDEAKSSLEVFVKDVELMGGGQQQNSQQPRNDPKPAAGNAASRAAGPVDDGYLDSIPF